MSSQPSRRHLLREDYRAEFAVMRTGARLWFALVWLGTLFVTLFITAHRPRVLVILALGTVEVWVACRAADWLHYTCIKVLLGGARRLFDYPTPLGGRVIQLLSLGFFVGWTLATALLSYLLIARL